jgi:hypothetical protein
MEASFAVPLHDGPVAAGPLHRPSHQTRSELSPSLANHQNSEGQMRSNGSNGRRVIGQRRQNTSARDEKLENQDWLAAIIASRSVQHVIDGTGMNAKAVQNIRQRKSKISFDNLVSLCRSDPEFAAAFCEYIGVLRPGEAEFAGALTKAFNAYQRRQA